MITLNWGILGAGNISGQFVHDLLLNNLENKEIKHVVRTIGCSSVEKGNGFIKDNNIVEDNNEGIVPVVESYEQFYKNKDINVVYIGTPHVFHKEQVIECLNNGLHVLCEKPMTINCKQSTEIFELAKSKNLFLMEAVWTRFLPIVNQIKSVIDSKEIGDVFRLFADFAFNGELDSTPKESRVRNKHLGAGALLDIGIYSITYGRILLDDKLGEDHTPFQLRSLVSVDETDHVDYNTTAIIKYDSGKHGILTCSNYGDSIKPFARVEATAGYIEIFAENPARPRLFKVHYKDGQVKEFKDDTPYNGFIYEANAVAKDIAANKTENDVVPPAETLLVMEMMDKIRYENDFKYPME